MKDIFFDMAYSELKRRGVKITLKAIEELAEEYKKEVIQNKK